MKNIEFLESAEVELDETVIFYNQQLLGLGDELLSEAVFALERIRKHPNAWQKLSKRTRRCLMHRFPYGIIYQERDDVILIVAVANLHREPTYWQERISS